MSGYSHIAKAYHQVTYVCDLEDQSYRFQKNLTSTSSSAFVANPNGIKGNNLIGWRLWPIGPFPAPKPDITAASAMAKKV